MSRLRSLLSWLKPLRYIRRESHNASVPEAMELPIESPDGVASPKDVERKHLESVITENDRRLAALRAQVNAQLRR